MNLKLTLFAGAAAIFAASLPAMAQDATTPPPAGTDAAPAAAAPETGGPTPMKHHRKHHRHRHHKKTSPDVAGETDAAPSAPASTAPAQ